MPLAAQHNVYAHFQIIPNYNKIIGVKVSLAHNELKLLVLFEKSLKKNT